MNILYRAASKIKAFDDSNIKQLSLSHRKPTLDRQSLILISILGLNI